MGKSNNIPNGNNNSIDKANSFLDWNTDSIINYANLIALFQLIYYI